jgi:hypothetical protein
VGQLGDGVVALPADARTREHLEWVADRVQDAGGTALLLQAHALSRRDEELMARRMAEARSQEYLDLTARAQSALTDIKTGSSGSEHGRQPQVLKKMRADLRAITRRDYFPPPEREVARRAVEAVASALDSSTSGMKQSTVPTTGEVSS